MNEPNVLIPISEYEKLKKAYEERNKPLEYPYGQSVSFMIQTGYPPFNNIDHRTKYYQCKEDLLKDFKEEVDKLNKVIEGLKAENSYLKILDRQVEHAPTFLGYKYFKV